MREKRKNKRRLVAAGCIAGALFLGTVGVYAGADNYYQDKFLPGTIIDHVDCSGMTVAQAGQQLLKSAETYTLTVCARNLEPQTIKGTDIAYQYLISDGIQNALKQQKTNQNFFTSFREKKYFWLESCVSYDDEKLCTQINQLDCMQPDKQTLPMDARLEYQNGKFVICPETLGTALNAEKTTELIRRCMEEGRNYVNLEEADVYLTAAVTQNDTSLLQRLEQINNWADAEIEYTFGEQTEVLDGGIISEWISAENDGMEIDRSFLENCISTYVANLAARYDTVGTVRNFTTSAGSVIKAGGGNYGWEIDQEAECRQLMEEILSGCQVVREPNYASTAMHPGPEDIGNTYIEVDLANQHLYFYREGTLVLESDIVSGDPDQTEKETPTGVFHMYGKSQNETLRGELQINGEYEYETPVQYWMPFNGGVGFHDAPWQAGFGEGVYEYSGSHGCINMPVEKASVLYEMIDTQMPIIVFL